MSEPIDLSHLGLGPLVLVHGALEARADDVLVTEANTALQMTIGIAGFLRKAGGIGIHKEAITHGPLPVGHIARTGPGQLKCKALYHAVLTDFFGRGMSAKVIATILGELLGLGDIEFE